MRGTLKGMADAVDAAIDEQRPAWVTREACWAELVVMKLSAMLPKGRWARLVFWVKLWWRT